MTTDEFDVDNWVERLARGMQRLAAVQDGYRQEKFRRRAHGARGDGFRNPSEEFRDLYWRASLEESDIYQDGCGPLAVALEEVRSILFEHPAWAGVMDVSGDGKISILFPGSGGMGDPLSAIAGLMARGKEAGEDGFRLACSELSQLLEQDDETDGDRRRAELLTGYHVALFQGLIFGEEVRVGDDLAIVPFAHLDAFVDADMLERLGPGAIRFKWDKTMAAVVKPFRWRPEFSNDGKGLESDWSGFESFCEDAEVLIELLALFHGAPTVGFASIPFRLHRRACLLLGNPNVHRSYSAKQRSWAFGLPPDPVAARQEAVETAARAFVNRDGERYRNCAPIITRLVEALARQGRFRTEDQILDVAIALERMYELHQGEISFKLKTRAASFLETRTKDRLRVFKDVQEFYDARAGIVHVRGGKGKKPKPKHVLERERQAAFDKGFDVARRTVVKLLNKGAPPDWNEMLLEAVGNGARERRGNAGTTVQGYRNRNGQTVIRRTDTPGNDHNQVVYELECGGCGCRYGANGSDIWQRKCPECGGGRPGLSYS